MMKVDWKKRKNKYFFPCPVHGGDNEFGATIFADEKPNWKCWTHSCHTKYGSSLYGFVKGYLSVDKEASKKDVCDFLNGKINFNTRLVDSNKISELDLIKILCISHEEETVPKPINMIRPSDYFMSRNFSLDTINLFGAGDCYDDWFLGDRAIVPIYNQHGKLAGYSGRTLIGDKIKWKNSYGFVKNNHLYNYNLAKSKIFESGKATIVEGFLDLWRVYEAGITNCVALMGACLLEYQAFLLEKSGAFHLNILTDMDEAGREAAKSITRICGRIFTYNIPTYNVKDPEQLSKEDIIKLCS